MPFKLNVKPPALPSQTLPEAPTSATAPKRKLTIKFGSASQEHPPSTELSSPAPPPAKPKAPRKAKADKSTRTSKPTPKKRAFDASAIAAGADDGPEKNGLGTVKRLKLSIGGQSKPPPETPKEDTSKIKYIRTKFKGKIPDRPIGVGYDSGSSDVENDPALEEQFILRMEPGEDCDYLRWAIAERKWGPANEGGVDVRMQFLMQDGRRALLSIRKNFYAACFVDLPCVIEGMKSWDKKSWFKTADICQMLLVLGPIKNESEAMNFPLPKEIDPQTWQCAHGLTPPMRYARKRRFRKRISNRTIEAVEEEVERLLALDAECKAANGIVYHEVVDPDRLTQDQQDQNARDQAQDREEYGDDDAEGDEDEGDEDEEEEDIENNFEPIEEDEGPEDDDDDAALEAAMAKAMEEDDEDAATPEATNDTPIQTLPPAATPDSAVTISQPLVSSPETPSATTPAAAADTPAVDSGDDASSSDEDAEELDEAEIEKQQERERQWAEVNDLKSTIANQEAKAKAQPNAILKSKILSGVKTLRRDLEVKLVALGVEDGEEE